MKFENLCERIRRAPGAANVPPEFLAAMQEDLNTKDRTILWLTQELKKRNAEIAVLKMDKTKHAALRAKYLKLCSRVRAVGVKPL